MKHKIKRNIRVAKVVIYKETLVNYKEHFWTFLGSFTGIALIGLLNSYFLDLSENLFLIGSFGASAVLIYGVINSPLAQPRNLIGGHLLSAFIGVSVGYVISETWVAAALAVSMAIVVMQITKTYIPQVVLLR